MIGESIARSADETAAQPEPAGTAPPASGRARAGSMVTALADQGSQSLVNLVLSLAAARALSIDDFGRFSVAFIVLTVAWGFIRSLVTEPFIVDHAARPPEHASAPLGSLVGLLVTVVLPLAAVAAGAAVVSSGTWRTSWLFVALVLPLIASLEAVRAVNLAARRTTDLVVTAGAWLLLFAATGLVITVSTSALVPLLLAYLAATVATITIGLARLGRHPHPISLARRRLLRQGLPLGVEFLVTAAGVNLLVIVVAAIAGLDQSAGLRGAMVLAGPITTLMGGLRLGALADATRFRHDHGDQSWRSYAVRLCAVLLAIGAIGAAAIFVLAQRFGTSLLGETWTATDTALLPFLAASLLTATHLTGASILRARQLGDRVLAIRLFTTPTAIGPAVVGAVVDGAAGAATGFLVGVIIAAPVWLVAATRREAS